MVARSDASRRTLENARQRPGLSQVSDTVWTVKRRLLGVPEAQLVEEQRIQEKRAATIEARSRPK